MLLLLNSSGRDWMVQLGVLPTQTLATVRASCFGFCQCSSCNRSDGACRSSPKCAICADAARAPFACKSLGGTELVSRRYCLRRPRKQPLDLRQVASYKLPSVTCHACTAALWAARPGFISCRVGLRRYLYLSLRTEKLDTKRT